MIIFEFELFLNNCGRRDIWLFHTNICVLNSDYKDIGRQDIFRVTIRKESKVVL